MRMHTKDPVELTVAAALISAGIRFVHESETKGQALDFLLPDFGDLFIECKQFATDRTGAQIAPFPNVIVIQGKAAADAFAKMLSWRNRGIPSATDHQI